MNLMMMNPDVEEMAQIIAEEKPSVVTTGAGNPGKYVKMWKEQGIKVIPVVSSVAWQRDWSGKAWMPSSRKERKAAAISESSPPWCCCLRWRMRFPYR